MGSDPQIQLFLQTQMESRGYRKLPLSVKLLALICLIIGLSPFAQTRAASLDMAIEKARHGGIGQADINRILGDEYLRKRPADRAVAILERLGTLSTGVPRGPFVAKVEEGLLKRVTVGRILRAIDTMERNYLFGIGLMGERLARLEPHEREACASILVSSFDLGLSRQEVGTLFRNHPRAALLPLAVAAEIKAMLRQIAFDQTQSQEILAAGVESGSFNLQWRKLPVIIQLSSQRGVPASDIGRNVIHALRSGKTIRSLLPTLSFSGRNLVDGPAVE
jgi:hypothetical protein